VFLDLLDAHVSDAAIHVVIDGDDIVVGNPERDAPDSVVLAIHRERFFARVLGEGNLGLGESFMDGDASIERGEMWQLLTILLRARLDRAIRGDWRAALAVLRVQAANLLRRHQWRQVQRHYDLGDDLFESFLDSSMTYSCGYARTPNDSLETMQFNKLDRICQKLEIAPGDRVLDIGCGFGGLLLHAARHYGATGIGITTSRRHCEGGNARIRRAGLADRIHLELRDHRSLDASDVTGRFDRVVSVGMMEHLPRVEYARYFRAIAAALQPHGIALVHVIGCTTTRNDHDPFIQKYIFPGSGQVRLAELALQVERHGMAVRDVENMRTHYAYTAKHWLERFRANRHRLDASRYGERFARMWEHYLHSSIAAGFASDGALFQVLFMKDYTRPIPLVRV
jgi:cyclopropane-fatty-acyl-phospholipid synthase